MENAIHPNFYFIFFKIWFSNDVSQSHVIYHFGKCVTIIWNKILENIAFLKNYIFNYE
jgi:hypothetical protein